jgi:hypothetical protein
MHINNIIRRKRNRKAGRKEVKKDMSELRDLLIAKTIAVRETIEDFEKGRILFMQYLHRVKELALEISEILDKWDFMAKH